MSRLTVTGQVTLKQDLLKHLGVEEERKLRPTNCLTHR